MLDPVILYSLLGGFALLFALSALEKYQDMALFRELVGNYHLVPQQLVPLAAAGTFVAEVTATTLLMTPAWLYGVTLALCLLTAYTTAIAVNVLRGRTHIDCGCLGSKGEGISGYHILRNSLLILLLAVCLLPATDRSLLWFDYLSVILFIAASGATYATVNQLISHWHQQKLWWS